jgi:hypothetical protein
MPPSPRLIRRARQQRKGIFPSATSDEDNLQAFSYNIPENAAVGLALHPTRLASTFEHGRATIAREACSIVANCTEPRFNLDLLHCRRRVPLVALAPGYMFQVAPTGFGFMDTWTLEAPSPKPARKYF